MVGLTEGQESMGIKVVLFDLDGTLLPMDQDVFLKKYMGLLAKKFAPYGYEPEKLMQSIRAGVGAMLKNNGAQTNEDIFWTAFAKVYGANVKEDFPLFDNFYRNEFIGAKDACGYTPQAAEAIAKVKEKGLRTALATNPIFPRVATENRMGWAGLSPDDFELYTTYEMARYCKPNPEYYMDIVEQMGVLPKECLMVGNDVTDDMVAAELGMKVFLLTDSLINKAGKDISVYPNGGFSELLEFLDTI